MNKSLPKSRLRDGTVVVYIGGCSGTREAVDHVTQLLAASGIEVFIEGSVMYDIAVLESAVGRAQELLKADAVNSRFQISLYPV